jgi:hypothetical protein
MSLLIISDDYPDKQGLRGLDTCEHDRALCVRLARFRLLGEGPKRTVLILRMPNASYAVRGDGQTRQEADYKAVAKAKSIIASYLKVA